MNSFSESSSKKIPRRVFPENNWIEGISDFNKTGGSYIWARGVDYRTEPSQMQLLPQAVAETGKFSDLVKWSEQVVGRTVILGNSTNLVTNGGFETNTTGWTLGTAFTRASDDAYLGSFAIKQVSAGGTDTFTTASGSGITVTPYTDYQISFYAKVAVSSGLPPQLTVLGGALTGLNILSAPISLTDTGGVWTQITATFNTGQYSTIFLSIANLVGTVTAHYDVFAISQINSLATYALGNAGNFYKRYSNSSWVSLGILPNSHGNGMAYYGEDDFVYVFGDKTMGRYGPVSSGTPTLVSDYLTAAGGVPTNTNSIQLLAANSDYAVKTSPSTALTTITGDISLEVFVKPSSLPTVGNSMTLMGLWNEATNKRAYKLDISAVSGVFGTGANGSLTISTNTTDAPIDSACSGTIATNQLFANNASFAAGQQILIIQMQGTGAGTYQETTIQSYDSTNHIITTNANLNFSYNSSGSNRAQILVVKQYTNVTINSGVTWTAKAWNGTTGGILAFMLNGTFTSAGTIVASGCGFRGGTGSSTGSQTGFYGESPNQAYNTGYYNNPSSPTPVNVASPQYSGGGANTVLNGGGGGGGAGFATAGQQTFGNAFGGTTYGTTDATELHLGSGGGGGAYDNGNGGNGGPGGGLIFATIATFTNTGTILNTGNTGTAGSQGTSNTGGSGSGGQIVIRTQSGSLGTMTATGGIGSFHSGGQAGDGRIYIDYLTSLSGTATPTPVTNQDNTLVTSVSYQARLGISNDGTAFEYLTQNLQALQTGVWDRLAVSWAAATSIASFYENASLIGTSKGTKTAIYGSSTADFAIGANVVSSYANFYDGEINDGRVWNTQRTQAQLAANNLVNLGGVAAGLVGNWFLTATGNDTTSNANNLVATGTPTPGYVTDVPYPGATTRLDVDQTGGGTGNTYTLPTTLTEAQKLSFVPALDPQKSFQVNLGTKGTGNITAVIHDGLNNQVALVTVANTNLPATGLYEFVYPQVFVPVVGATYHAHFYSSVNDATIKTTAASDLTTAQFTTYYQFLVSDTEYHPAMVVGNVLGIGNGRYLAVQDAAAGYNSRRLRFPAGWRVRCLALWRNMLAIGCWRGTAIKDFDQGIVFLWDGYSITYNDYFFVPEGAINAMWGENDILYIVAGYHGDILEYTGTTKNNLKVKRLPKVGKGNYVEVLPGAMTFYDGLLRIGASYNSDSTTFERGVYTWGTLNTKYPKSLSFDYPVSTGNRGSSVQIGALMPVGGELLMYYQDNTSYGANNISPTNLPQTTGTYEALITDLNVLWKSKDLQTVRADHKPLSAGANVDVKYKINYESSWHNLGITGQSVGDQATRLPLPAGDTEYHALQIGIDLYASQGISPVVLEDSQLTDLLITESDEHQTY